MQDKIEHLIQIRNLKEALSGRVALKNVHRAIKFIQETLLKSFIEINTKLNKNAINHFEKYFKLLMNKARSNYLVSEPNYHTIKPISDNLWAAGTHEADTDTYE